MAGFEGYAQTEKFKGKSELRVLSYKNTRYFVKCCTGRYLFKILTNESAGCADFVFSLAEKLANSKAGSINDLSELIEHTLYQPKVLRDYFCRARHLLVKLQLLVIAGA
jgi:hypothetical protein